MFQLLIMMSAMVNATSTISIVIPVYNEEESVRPLAKRIQSVDELQTRSYEVIFVDDGSQDSTFNRLAQLHRQDKRFSVVRFRKNFGQTAAMAAGFQIASGEIIISMDGDLQNDPADIPRLLDKMAEGYDVVCGWRQNRKDKWLSRRLPAMIANGLIGKVTGVSIRDTGCSLKAYRADVIKRIPLYAELHRFIPAMSTLTGARIAEVGVRHHARQFGKSKYGLSRVWRVALDLVLVKMLTGYAGRPAMWFGLLSLPALFLGMICLLGLLVLSASSAVLLSLAFLSFALAFHLLTLGCLGEMVLQSGDVEPSRMLSETTLVVRSSNRPKPV